MFRMEIDSPSSSSSSELDAPILSPKDRILKRLALIDVSEESLEHMQPGIIAYVKRNSSRLQEIFNAILPSDYEIQTAIEAEADPGIEDLLHESMVWLQWLMFDGDPVDMLQRLALLNVGQRGVCGSVWASGEMAYRCRTCEIDPTCAICVPCFVNGDHKDHDYSVIKTGSGCCDCGDVTGWKRSGFCSKHKGAEQIQPLQEDIAKTLGPVLDCLLRHWKNSLLFMDNASEPKAVADVLTSAVVGMLLEFCKCSESLLGFVSGRLCYEVDLLDVLVRAERFLSLDAVSKLHKLLLKLLSDPFFKYEFAKAFIKYYPTVVNDVLQESTDATFQNLPLLSTFGVQIFTVPTLTPRLVKEMDLLTMLLECLSKIFSSCSGQDHRLEAVEGNDARFGGHGVEGDYTNELEVLSLADWPEIEYDVSSQEISVHIPLHRLLSLALQRALKRCYGESESSAYGDFFGHVLGGCHPYGFSAFVMEHPLRIRVFCSQVRAGMWRKNGDAALASYEWYRFVKWSEQGLELDIFLLQCCAALAPADFYIARIVERFGLSDYLSLNMERANEYEPALVQEMLNLIIQILKERRFCGLTTAQCLQRELIYKLSSGNATHSELANSLPRDLSNVDQLQQVLDTVAEYTYPSGTKQGMYQLRLEYWKELDLYHPRWNLQDLQAAEERYLRFCNASAMANQLPKWSKIYPPLNGLAKVATCKTVLQIIRAVLFYALFTDKLMESRAPDGVLVTSLHLLSLALDISQVQIQGGDMDNSIPLLGYAGEEIFTGFNDGHDHQSLLSLLVSLMRKNQKENTYGFVESGGFDLSSLIKDLLQKFAELDSGCLKKLQILAPEVVNLLSHSKPSSDTSNSASMSDSDKRKAKARERQATIMEKMKAQQSKFMENINSTAESGLNDSSDAEERISDVANGSDGHEQVICSLCHDANSKSPVSFLILLQKSSVASLLDKGFPSWEKDVQRSGKEQALNNDDTFNNQSSSSVETLTSSQLMDSVQNAINEFASTSLPHEVNAFPRSSHDNSSQAATSLGDLFEESMYTHILNNDLMKSEDLSAASCSSSSYGSSNESLLLGKYVASLYDEIANNPSPSETRGSHSNTTPSSVTLGMTYDGFGPSDCNGIYVSSCGHAVHQGCLDRYLPSLKERDSRRTDLEGGHIVDPRQGEFLCPACRGLANSILPDLPREETKDIWQSKSQNLFPSDVNNVSLLRRPLSLLQAAADVSRRNEILRAIPVQQKRQKDTNLEYMVPLLRELYFPGNDKVSGSSRVSDSMIMWDTLKYSLVSTEIAARSEKTSSATILSTGALYEELRSSNGFILSLLLKIAQKNRVQSSLDIPLRLWCTQQFAKSICCVDTLNEPRNDAYRVGEYMTSTLGSTDMSIRFPNLQVWAMASYPVLASDAFSTLMWILFCLPVPFMYSEKTFFPLVHICYVVSITQAAITYIGRNESIHDFRHHDSLLSDIFKFSIRRLSFPFLRRCAILWKLMNSSTSSPFSGVLRSSKTFEDRMDHASGTLNETIEIEELEKVFKIPPLDNIVNDELSRSLVKKWLQHIAKDFKVNNPSGVLHLTPVVPVKLMVLPYLYQDLLQRYMKWKCVNCGAAQDKPALCLLCGLLCSPRWKTCCRDDTCQTHAMSCGAGTGVFLLIRETRILLQRSAHQAFWPSPYLDAFGEEDIGMRRGKPLYLNEERYAALSHMVASHGIGRSSKV
ncbi:putative carboxypeptidase U transcription factor interactor and regulator Znf-B family [Helianthus annuus]|nr:putative carboxypeptidase U transcription factor interactor and regulator Znf-B family [Helianthus annuus]KAJ0573501.1 putative carboxypeptidase U transcription factor interactor and regulator Znf-B family [Helianthus annuus]